MENRKTSSRTKYQWIKCLSEGLGMEKNSCFFLLTDLISCLSVPGFTSVNPVIASSSLKTFYPTSSCTTTTTGANPTNGLIFKTSNLVLVPDPSLEEVHQFHLFSFGLPPVASLRLFVWTTLLVSTKYISFMLTHLLQPADLLPKISLALNCGQTTESPSPPLTPRTEGPCLLVWHGKQGVAWLLVCQNK